ncbi:hypothetical protein BH09MYX1_BH09MYX1_24460 [soil metagenome]
MRQHLLLPLCILSVALAACGGDDTSVPTVDSGTKDTSTTDSSVADSSTTDSSVVDSSTTDGGVKDSSADVEAGPVVVNGCTQFTDKSAKGDLRDITFPLGQAPAQYTPNCMKVKAGQTVNWAGAFTNHPLTSSGGDSGSPITTTSTGTTKDFTFTTAGTYGFACQFHGGSMFGAIQVVP